LGRLAVETGIFPLYEVIDGNYKISIDLPKLRPVEDYFRLQGRFRHLTKDMVEKIQERVLREYEKLKLKEKMSEGE
jgi:pyruvate ferredoxin oxidoreductase beta subunit